MPISATLKHTTHQMATRSARPNLGESLLALHAPRPERLLESVLIPQGDRGPRRLLHVNSITTAYPSLPLSPSYDSTAPRQNLQIQQHHPRYRVISQLVVMSDLPKKCRPQARHPLLPPECGTTTPTTDTANNNPGAPAAQPQPGHPNAFSLQDLCHQLKLQRA